MAAITSGQQVLLPESSKSKRKQRTITVAVNSRDRNLSANNNTNQFRWVFRRPLKDIVSIELVNGYVPADLYNINTGWNMFTFGEDTTIWQVTLTPGQYTPAQLAAELQTRLNGLSGVTNTYTVAYSTVTKKMTISATGGMIFTFYFLTTPHKDIIDSYSGSITSINCPARILGFVDKDYPSDSGTIIPPNRADTDIFLKKLYLHLNADNSIELNRIELGAGRKDCFHILFLDQIVDGYYPLNKDLHTPIFYSSPAPLARMAALNVSIRDEFYRLVDLSLHDFTLMFEITFIE
jgi:hypothetical protein